MKQFRVHYNDETDRFELESNCGDGWELAVSVPCVNKEGDGENYPKMFVHCSILIEMQKRIDRGYVMVN